MAEKERGTSPLIQLQDHNAGRLQDFQQYHSLQFRHNGDSNQLSCLRTPQYFAPDRRFHREYSNNQEGKNRDISPPCNQRNLSLSPSPSPQHRSRTLYQVSPEKPIANKAIVIHGRPSPLTNKFRDAIQVSDAKKTDISIRELDSLASNVISAASNDEYPNLT